MIFVSGYIYEGGQIPVPIVYDNMFKFGLSSDSHIISKLGHEAAPWRTDLPVLQDGIVISCKDGVYTCKQNSWYFNDAPIMWGPEVEYMGHIMTSMFLQSGQFYKSGVIRWNGHIYDLISSTSSAQHYFLSPELNGLVLEDACYAVRVPCSRDSVDELMTLHNAEALIWTDQGLHVLKSNGVGIYGNPEPHECHYKILTNLNYMSLSYTDFHSLFTILSRREVS